MKELKLGEKVTVQCVEDTEGILGCTQCYFRPICNRETITSICMNRLDGKNIHFELVR